MSYPKVTIVYGKGGLLKSIDAVDGIAGIVGTGSTTNLLGVPKVVFSLADAESKGYTSVAEPSMHRHLKEFYGEVGGKQTLYVMTVPDTMLMAQMLTDTEANSAKKLTAFAGGKIRLLGVYRTPNSGYDAGNAFFDSDVSKALTTSKVFGEARLAALIPLRMFVEGRVANVGTANSTDVKSSANGFTGVVCGGSKNDGSASVGLALGRVAKYAAHIKLGKVANGATSLTECYIGDKKLADFTGLEALHGDGVISFMQHPQKAGYYFGIDRMASTDDYRLLAHGRVVDKAAVIAAAVYIEELENEVETDDKGKLDSLEVIRLESAIEQQVQTLMAGQISGFEAIVDPDSDIINTQKTKITCRVQPLGYNSFIDVELGLTARL